MRVFITTLLLFTTLLFPYIHCVDLDQYDIADTEEARKELFKYLEEETKTDFKNKCITEGGVGSEFSMQVTQFVKTCAEYSGSKKGYLKFQFMCDYCTSLEIKKGMELFEKECADACMSSDAYCEKADLIYEGGWGGMIVNNEICGDFDPTLPGCAESSSSENISSSSIPSYSSSDSNGDSSSSYEGGTPTGCEESGSSSSDCENEPENPGNDKQDGMINCSYARWINLDGEITESCSYMSHYGFGTYYNPPTQIGGINEIKNLMFATCDFLSPILYTYIRPIYVESSDGAKYACYDNNSCSGESFIIKNIDETWRCAFNAILSPNQGCPIGEFTSSGADMFIFIITPNGQLGVTGYPRTYYLPSNIRYNDIVNQRVNLYRSISNSVPSEILGKNLTYEEIYSICDSIYNYEEDVDLDSIPSTPGVSSSSIHPLPFSSSDNPIPDQIMSSFEEISSSSEDLFFSSSSFESSSSSEESSSSSAYELCQEHPFENVPSNPENACFTANGKCYKCNPDRESDCYNDWLWIYDFNSANVGWWYEEVDCETGLAKKEPEEFLGQCPIHPLKNVPSNLENACFAANGKCYKCNPDRGSDCSNDWLWIYDFNSANIGWWYEEVDCEKPFEEEKFIKQCYEITLEENKGKNEIFLLKQQVTDNDIADKKASYGEFLETKNYFYSYDVLGRSISKNKTNEHLFKFIKANTIVPEQNQSILLLKEGKMYDGYVTGTVQIVWCEVDKDTSGDYEVRSIEVRMHVNSGTIHVECNDVRLIAHEKKHKEIWDNEKNNVNEIITVTIPKNFSSKDVCWLEAEKAWPYVRDVLYNIYTAHNKWDDEDINNISHERIDVYSKMQENQDLFFRKCK